MPLNSETRRLGGSSLVMRGAVRVGDSCQIDGVIGTVEDIGMSALSLRTLDRSVVSIPNSKVAEEQLENFSLRDQFWLHHLLTLKMDTPHPVLRAVSNDIYKLLEADLVIDKSTARARVVSLSSTGPQIEVFAYFRQPRADWDKFLAYPEDLLFRIMGVIDAAGASLAVPVSVLKMNEPPNPTSSATEADSR